MLSVHAIKSFLLIFPALTLGRKREAGGGELGGCNPPPPLEVVLIFFSLDDKTSPEVFSSCSFILCAHFETSLVVVIYYVYEILRHKQQVVKPLLSEQLSEIKVKSIK